MNSFLSLSSDDLDRLGKFLGMLGSDADAERALAGAKADALLRERGSSWGQLVTILRTFCVDREATHREHARECLQVQAGWTEKETDFLLNMMRRRRDPTPDQAEWLARLLQEARQIARKAA